MFKHLQKKFEKYYKNFLIFTNFCQIIGKLVSVMMLLWWDVTLLRLKIVIGPRTISSVCLIASATEAGCSERHHFLLTRGQMRTVSWSLPLYSCCLLFTFAFGYVTKPTSRPDGDLHVATVLIASSAPPSPRTIYQGLCWLSANPLEPKLKTVHRLVMFLNHTNEDQTLLHLA